MSAKKKKLYLPDPDEVAKQLHAINFEFEGGSEEDDDEYGVDVRLQVSQDGNWQVHFGDAQYDTDHRGYWGSSSVPGSNKDFDAEELALDLIDQVADDAAQDDLQPIERSPKHTKAGRSR